MVAKCTENLKRLLEVNPAGVVVLSGRPAAALPALVCARSEPRRTLRLVDSFNAAEPPAQRVFKLLHIALHTADQIEAYGLVFWCAVDVVELVGGLFAGRRVLPGRPS